jgi:hypothetical protein
MQNRHCFFRDGMRTAGDKAPQLMVIIFLLVFLAGPSMAADWAAPAAELARSIAAITGPGAATLTMRNISSFPADQLPELRRLLETQLHSAGVRLVDAGAMAAVRVTLSENAQGWLWVAEATQGNEVKVSMLPVLRSSAPPTSGPGHSVSLRRTLLWVQDEPILDAVIARAQTSNPRLIVLSPAAVTLYTRQETGWKTEQALSIPHLRVWPQDLRGRLVLDKEHLFDAYLPAVVCSSAVTEPVSMKCRESDDPWPLGAQKAFFNSARNYFTGVLAPGNDKQTAPFFSAADLQKGDEVLWVFASVDGKVRLLEGHNESVLPSAFTREWGSDIAAVRSSCGTGTQLLASSAGDAASQDFVRAYEVLGREVITVSAPLEFAGPITALWTAGDGSAATIVVRNLKTSAYEVFTLSVSCTQ